jgi:hypothetical protein
MVPNHPTAQMSFGPLPQTPVKPLPALLALGAQTAPFQWKML